MVPVLVMHDRAEAGVVAAAARREEVDARAVVVRVAHVGDVRVDRERSLARDGGIGGVRRQHHVTHLVRLVVAVRLRGLRHGRRVVEGEGGRAAVGDGLRRDRDQGVASALDDPEVTAVDRGRHAHAARAGVGDVEVAGCVGVVRDAADHHARVGQALRHLGVARVGLRAVGDLAVHRAGHGAVQDLALLVQDLAGVGVDHELHLAMIRRVPRTAARGDELDRQARGHRIGVDAGPHHVAGRGHLGRRAELVHGLARVDRRVHRRGREIAPLQGRGELVAEILQRAAAEHHRERILVRGQTPHPAAEHGHAAHMLLPVDGREGGVGAVGLVHQLELVRAVVERTDRLQLLERHAPQRAPVHQERLHAVVRRGTGGEALAEHAPELAAHLDERAAGEGVVEATADVESGAGRRHHGGGQQRRGGHGRQCGGTGGEQDDRDGASCVTHAVLSWSSGSTGDPAGLAASWAVPNLPPNTALDNNHGTRF